jgi:Bacterial regulatory proteins, luxR family
MTGFEVLQRLNSAAVRTHTVCLSDYLGRPRKRAARAPVRRRRLCEQRPLRLHHRSAYRGVARAKLLPKFVRLKDREVEVLTQVARGETSADIARKLRLSKRTVDFSSRQCPHRAAHAPKPRSRRRQVVIKPCPEIPGRASGWAGLDQGCRRWKSVPLRAPGIFLVGPPIAPARVAT